MMILKKWKEILGIALGVFFLYIVREKKETQKKDFMLHLCKSLDDGPKWPKPDAIVLISTIATQQ